MKKLIYSFFLAALILFFAGCVKNSADIPGPTGPAGATGAPGGDLTGLYLPYQLTVHTVKYGTSPYYYAAYPFPGYDSNYTYLLNVFVQRISFPVTKEWYKLPLANVYGTDELYASLGHDTIKIWYYNAGSAWPTDSSMNVDIQVIPQQVQP